MLTGIRSLSFSRAQERAGDAGKLVYRAPVRRKTREDSGYASRIVDFKPGAGQRFNQSTPELMLGRPEGAGALRGSLHVVSLGHRGSVTLELGRPAQTGIVVFENPFRRNGLVANKEPAKVEVSADGVTWYAFPRSAGAKPVFSSSRNVIDPRETRAGGDRFKLADAGVPAGFTARFVRITDKGLFQANSFDLDAVYGY